MTSGLEAYQKVLAAHQCYAMTATTALTVQNTHGVQDIHITPPRFVARQIKACLEDVGADVVKIGKCAWSVSWIIADHVAGMLASAETILEVEKMLQKFKVVVLDPVCY